MTVPLTAVQGCTILQMENLGVLTTKAGMKMYTCSKISVYIEYEVNGEIKQIHFIRPDGFEQLNEMITYLQDEKHIPIYYVLAPWDNDNSHHSNEARALKMFEKEPITFNGDLESYLKK